MDFNEDIQFKEVKKPVPVKETRIEEKANKQVDVW
jgi:hypothetical protein